MGPPTKNMINFHHISSYRFLRLAIAGINILAVHAKGMVLGFTLARWIVILVTIKGGKG